MHAFDRTTGRERWMYPTSGGVLAAIVGFDRRVFASTAKGDLVCLDLDTGKPHWTFALNGLTWESPAVLGNRVFAGSTDGTLYALGAETGQIEWKTSLRAPVTTSVRIAGTVAYIGTRDGVIHRVDLRDGNVLSSLSLDDELFPASSPLATDDSLLVLLADAGADYRALVSIDSSLERVRWRHEAKQPWSTSRMFVWKNSVVLGAPPNEVTARCLEDGSHAWSSALGGRVRAIGGSDDALYVGTVEGTLSALRPPASCDATVNAHALLQ